MIDRVWLQLASQWLQNESTDIDTIGLRLGYASGASFARAFKRVAGVLSELDGKDVRADVALARITVASPGPTGDRGTLTLTRE